MKPGKHLAAALAALCAVAGLSAPSGADALELSGPPDLAAAVSAGELPPVRERVPEPPAVAALDAEGQSLGEHGGALTMLMGRQKDIRMMMVYGYARLVEIAPRDALFSRPVHPYTRALLAAVPYPDPDRKLDYAHLSAIKAASSGVVPAPFTLLDGTESELIRVGEAHFVRAAANTQPEVLLS